ncbi:MAG: AAA family ATPase, partial [Myxococcota bacterium]
NLAAAFEEAAKSASVLLIDEVDSFLPDRDNSNQHWQTTMVNEMLTQMERFEGVFVATTNRREGLDPATQRRFDLTIEFNTMRPDQVKRLFRQTCRELDVTRGVRRAVNRVGDIEHLTPGDFAAARRRHRFHPFVDAQDLADELERIASDKPAARPRIGF